MNKIKSPMNYIGNKYRILDQIKVYFPDMYDIIILIILLICFVVIV